MRKFIGVKLISAKPMTNGEACMVLDRPVGNEGMEQQGYLIEYPDGYKSWSPKSVFEASYFPLSDFNGSKISPTDVDRMVGPLVAEQISPTSTLVKAERTLIGFDSYQVSSCCDPANYNHDTGMECGAERIRDDFWKCLGFVLKWALNGLGGR